ncbi:MAG: hypothetical protein LH615_06780 [Ferruginibacter sp.]|nr:hypothetical protein [Ferruginibacter sp.]
MKSTFKTVAIFLFATVLFSCQKADIETAQKPSDPNTGQGIFGRNGPGDCTPKIVSLIAGQHINAGTVSVTNDDDFIYVTYTTANGYTIKQTHLYVGKCALIPVNRSGNAVPGQFPYASAHSNITSYTYLVPISAIIAGNCGCIAAHAVVQKLDGNGHVIDEQTAWGNGTRINPRGGSWGMKFEYCSCSQGN